MRGAPSTTTKSQRTSPVRVWEFSGGSISLAEPVVMGVLNLTPDSFSDGGELSTVDAALRRADRMVREGARILDVGGESTRPGAAPVEVGEELERVVPVIEALTAQFDVSVSIDTRKAKVAEAALAAGAAVVNDVSALGFDPDMVRVVARAGAGVVLMHMRGIPEDMRDRTQYGSLVGEVAEELEIAVAHAQEGGIRSEAIVLDPGIGFAKTSRQSLMLLGEIPSLTSLGFPVMVGPSRKSFLGDLLGVPPKDRVAGTVAACLIAYQGGARLFRVHDVAPAVHALGVVRAVEVELAGGSTS